MHLSQKEEIEKITINDIAHRADVSRGTVYLNFEDKYDLLDKMIEYYLNELFSVCSEVNIHESTYFPKIIEKMYTYLFSNKEIYKQLFIKPYFSKFRSLFEKNLLYAFENQKELNELKDVSTISLQFLTSGITGCIVFWLQENNLPPEKATTLLCDYLEDHDLLAPFVPNLRS